MAPNGSETLNIQSSGGNAIINQTDGNNRVFNIDQNSAGGTTVSITGLTIQGGQDGADNFGGAGILAGSVSSTPKDVLNLTNCFLLNNHCKFVNSGYTGQVGGGVQMAGGDLNVSSCVFSNNSSQASQGGAIEFFTQTPINSNLRVINSSFFNNGLTNTSGSGPDGGGAINIASTAGSTHVILGSTFTGNTANSTGSGNTFGGAISLNTGVLNVTNSTFTGNSAPGTGSLGGAIYVDSGTLNMSFCRFAGNSANAGGNAVYNHGSNGANTLAANNWWGVNTGPGAAGAGSNGGTLTTSPFIVLTNAASPNPIVVTQSTTLTAGFLQNSAGTILSAAQIPVLIGLPVTWNNAILGTLSGQQTTIQANGAATAQFTAGNVTGTGQADATVDSGTVTGSVTINCPTITGTVSGGASFCAGGAGVIEVDVTGGYPPYTVTMNNSGGTQTGSSPLFFTNSPAATTVYQVASGSDVNGCAIAASGSATNIVVPAPSAAIAAAPTGVCADSSGNSASGPASLSGYSWTISNGTINSATNLQNISYTAGSAGSVTLSLSTLNANGCGASASTNVTIHALPTPTIIASSSVCGGSTNTASVNVNARSLTPVPGLVETASVSSSTYAWQINNGNITTSVNAQTITYTAGNSGSVTLTVTVRNTSGCTTTVSTNVTINPHPTAVVSGDATIFSGATTQLTAALTGTPPWSVTWSDGFTQTTNASPALHFVNPTNTSPTPSNFVYTVTALADGDCTAGNADLTGSATVSVYSALAFVATPPNQPIPATVTLIVTNTATEPLSPPLILTYSLVNPPAGATIDTNGVITWTPDETFIGVTTNITTIVTDNGTPSQSATNTFAVTVTCPNINATVSGGASFCPGGAGVVRVDVTGGSAPYTITLNNGGGTQTSSSPLLFTISPAATTTYQISSGADFQGCSVSASGSATMTVNPVTIPAITLVPASVLANSGGNQASAPAGFAGYAWTISNGLIIGLTNQPVITYTAGTSNQVVLSLTVINGYGCSGVNAVTVPIITGFSVHTNVTFTDALASTTMTMAFDGTNYWSCSGGNTNGTRLASYGLTGAPVATYAPGLDFRSLTTKADGTLLARAYNSGVIYQQTSPGVFAPSGVTLTGGTLDPQSAVVLNGAGTEFDAVSGGVVSRWSTNGTYLGTVNLIGFGTLATESYSWQNRRLAAFGNFWLTYNGADILSVWDNAGNRLSQITLAGAGTDRGNSSWSFSYCNGKVFIVDTAGGTWRGFDLFAGARVAVLNAENSAAFNSDVTNKIAGVGPLPGVDLISVIGGGPVPTLAQLRAYQSVLVYSDAQFNDSTGLGNVLADYVDQGGGVALAAFSFYSSPAYSVQGRMGAGGYLPFTTGSVLAPATLTLVKDLPLHPLLDGVDSFNGGTKSYHNSITTTAGASLVAHWSDAQPLVGAKDTGAGRTAGLNFFPPSSDARNDLWVSSTDGAQLMVNALLWSGKIPPTILSAPADQSLPVGATANFAVVAAGTAALGYQWRHDGTNLPAATGRTLSFTVNTGSSGAYSVVVSNRYGATTSLNAMLNPQLRLLVPAVSGGAFSLFLANADGSPVAANRAARVSLYATTNVALPLSLWTLLTNAVVSTGGQLRADGFSVTNGPLQFFRAAEAP